MPPIALLPVALVALLLIQFAAGLVALPPQALILALYLLWAPMILTLGQSLRQAVGLDRLATCFATAILAGALLAAVLLALQLSGSAAAWVFPLARGGANLGQANHLASYLWLGLASAIYLNAHGKIGLASCAVCTLVLISAASLTGSRSVILYATGFALLALWSAWRFHQPALSRIATIAVGLLAATLVLQWVSAHFEWTASAQPAVAGELFFREISGPSQRLQLWRTGLADFAEHPWLGAGVGQFPVQSYLLAGTQGGRAYLGGGEHAHNLLIDLLCEFGLLAPSLVLLFGMRWRLAFVHQAWSAAHWWIAAVLLVLATHSQLEYPLWYAYFLGIAALVLGAGSGTGGRPRIASSGRALIAVILLLGTVTLVTMANDYRKLERSVYGYGAGASENPAPNGTLQAL